MAYSNETNPADTVNRDRLDRNETAPSGAADAVEKTTYVGDVHGAEQPEPVEPVTASVGSGGGLGVVGWVTLVLAALALVAYAAGLF